MVILLFFVSQNTFACLSIALLDACVLLKHPQPSSPDLIGIYSRKNKGHELNADHNRVHSLTNEIMLSLLQWMCPPLMIAMILLASVLD